MSLIDAYSRLTAFQKNIPEGGFGVSSMYVTEYHEIVSLIEKETGLDLQQYKVPLGLIKPSIIASGGSRGPIYSQDSFCPRELLCMKVDALLTRFSLSYEEKKIGFIQ